MELSPRLKAVADWVPDGARLADIGTDHGFLPVFLLKQGRISGAVAADLRSGPLDTARRTAQRHGVSDRVSFRLCDGLSGVAPEEADTVTIAGMGGETIAEILAAAPWTRERGTLLLLQPQSAFPELRGWLTEHGYRISREKISREGFRLYTIIEVRGGEPEAFSPGELWAGKQSGDPLRGAYLDWLDGVLSKVLDGKRRAAYAAPDGTEFLRRALEDIRSMKKEWESWR